MLILQLRGGTANSSFITMLDAAADLKDDAHSEVCLHVLSMRISLSAHAQLSCVGEGNAPVAPAMPAEALLFVLASGIPFEDEFSPTAKLQQSGRHLIKAAVSGDKGDCRLGVVNW